MLVRSWAKLGLTGSLAWVALGCAAGADTGETFSLTAAPATASSTGHDPTGHEVGDGSALPDLGSCEDDADCSISDALCFQPQGVCIDGVCEFATKPAGSPCDDGDPCTSSDVCDGLGECLGDPMECTAPNATGQCANGVCTDLACNPGWGDCNSDPSDGCETSLDSLQNCGSCGEPCTAGPNAVANCSAGVCERACESPWENCDDDWSNGCEIPTGVPNQCDANGLNAQNGCWTAYCGSSNQSNATNFGTWFCAGCSTCNVPSGGLCQWCSRSAGVWYPADTCACGNFEHLVCMP